MLVRVMPGQFFLCDVLCNAAKIGQRGFAWFAFLVICCYLSFLEIDGRFFEKQDTNAVAAVRRCANACDPLSSSCLAVRGAMKYRHKFYG